MADRMYDENGAVRIDTLGTKLMGLCNLVGPSLGCVCGLELLVKWTLKVSAICSVWSLVVGIHSRLEYVR